MSVARDDPAQALPERSTRSGRGPRRPRQRLPPAERRTEIVSCARTLIARQGLSSTRMRDIAAAAEVSVGTVTYHFSGLEEILAEVLQLEMAEVYTAHVLARVRQEASGRTQLDSLVDYLLSGTTPMREHWYLWMDYWALSARSDRYARWQSEVYASWWDEVTGAFDRGALDGSLSVTDSRAAATVFMAMLDGLVIQAYLPAALLSPGQARAILHGFVADRAPSLR